jgi:type VI secretion system protein VasG
MIPSLDLTKLVSLLNKTCRRALEAAASVAVAEHASEVTHYHWLYVLTEQKDSDIYSILKGYDIPPEQVHQGLLSHIRRLSSGGRATGRPVFSSSLLALLQESWMIASVEISEREIRSGAVLLALLANPIRWDDGDGLGRLASLPRNKILSGFADLTELSLETYERQGTFGEGQAAGQGAAFADDSALSRYTTDFTAKALAGDIDPVFCRDREIRQVVDILGRRRKNNPICVGEAGVGKTAIIEGLALKIAQGDVPDFLTQVRLIGLDMGLLQAGASVKGEFENRLKAIIEEVRASIRPIILFIDEAHTLIGAGGPQGGSDAANLLKPALARGELRTIAATTWSEYKKYFEKDQALARRFQPVKLDEPSVADAATIMRGLRPIYEKAHGVYVRDDAIVAAAELSARFLAGRQLPDKAIDVLDTACARVCLSLSAKPAVIDELERKIAALHREWDARRRDSALGLHGDGDRDGVLADDLRQGQAKLATLSLRWSAEKNLVTDIFDLRAQLQTAKDQQQPSEQIFALLRDRQTDLDTLTEGHPLVQYEVCPETIGAVISDWTGIPTGRMVRDESRLLQEIAERLKERIRGQDAALQAIHDGILAAKVQLHNPNGPMGVFLLVGPTGVGKTETALAVADILFGGERFMTTINMSEYQEKHSVSRLIGSPPGYVGYGTGGILTEAVRQRPYSVVLLDEIEKADVEVMNLFYQVFDKGTLSDGEGREIDFRNTVIFMTSNLASDEILSVARQGAVASSELIKSIHPILARHLKPALLARMTVVPYLPVQGSVVDDIIAIKLGRLAGQLWDHHRITLHYGDRVTQAIRTRCATAESGARTIDHIIAANLLPRLSAEVVRHLGAEQMPEALTLDLADDGEFIISQDFPPTPHLESAPSLEPVL